MEGQEPRTRTGGTENAGPAATTCRAVTLGFFVFCVLFPVFLFTRWKPLYGILRLVFFAELGLLLGAFVVVARRRKIFVLVLLLVVGIRAPFYLQSDGLLFTTDNALEAIQSLEIRDDHTAPFSLLNSIGHNGVLKHLMISFIWDVVGPRYVVIPIFQTLLYLVFLAVLYLLFRRFFSERTSLILLAGQFAFIEVLFDYSLFLRAAPYFEMLLVFLIGAVVFDFSFRHPWRVFASAYFLAFSLYINQAALFLLVPFLLTAIVIGAASGARFRFYPILAGGLAAGAILPIYRVFFIRLAGTAGGWFRFQLLPLGDLLRPSRIPKIAVQAGHDIAVAFHNLIAFEFDYGHSIAAAFSFGRETAAARAGLWAIHVLGEVCLVAAMAAGLGLAVRGFRRAWRSDRRRLPWIYPFFFLQLATVVGRIVLLGPRPFLEPRHNLDLAFLLIISLYLVIDAGVRSSRATRLRSAAVVVLALLMALPSAFYFHKMARFKRLSYDWITSRLRENGVRYLAADYTIAYCIYFLTGRRVEVTDSIGPVIMDIAMPAMTKAVDALPDDRKAYFFFRSTYPRIHGLREKSRRSRELLVRRLKAKGIPFRSVYSEFYVLIIPEASRGEGSQWPAKMGR